MGPYWLFVTKKPFDKIEHKQGKLISEEAAKAILYKLKNPWAIVEVKTTEFKRYLTLADVMTIEASQNVLKLSYTEKKYTYISNDFELHLEPEYITILREQLTVSKLNTKLLRRFLTKKNFGPITTITIYDNCITLSSKEGSIFLQNSLGRWI